MATLKLAEEQRLHLRWPGYAIETDPSGTPHLYETAAADMKGLQQWVEVDTLSATSLFALLQNGSHDAWPFPSDGVILKPKKEE